MATLRSFEEMEAWKKTRELVREIYRVTTNGDFARDFALRDQIRRAAVSALSNISEGFERDGDAEFTQCLSIAKGSIGELRAQLVVATDVGYLNASEFDRLSRIALDAGHLIAGFIRYLRDSEFRGKKFPHPKTRDKGLGTRD
jgi:four helix bundle protein